MDDKGSKEEVCVKKNSPDFKLKKSEMWKYLCILFAVLLIISVATSGFRVLAGGKSLGKDAAAEKAIGFINENLLQPGMSAKIEAVEEKTNVYSVNISINNQKYNSFITKDGSILFTSGIEIDQFLAQKAAKPAEEPAEPAIDCSQNCDDPKCKDSPACNKVEKPKMTVWIESRCPFGIQAVNGLARVYDVLKGKSDLEVRYMVSNNNGEIAAMHGAEELAEDRRQVCIRNEQGYEKFMKYLRCYAETGQTTDCEPKSGVDSAKLSRCVTEKSTEYLAKDAADWKTIYVPKGGSGSPSFFLNDFKINEYETSQNGRSPDNLRNIICSNMINEVSGCNTELPKNNPPRGFGVIEGGAASTGATAASCG
jgi:hypothetical protein